jgi:hypothetical protein
VYATLEKHTDAPMGGLTFLMTIKKAAHAAFFITGKKNGRSELFFG